MNVSTDVTRQARSPQVSILGRATGSGFCTAEPLDSPVRPTVEPLISTLICGSARNAEGGSPVARRCHAQVQVQVAPADSAAAAAFTEAPMS